MSGNLNPTKNAMRGLTVFISDLRNGMYCIASYIQCEDCISFHVFFACVRDCWTTTMVYLLVFVQHNQKKMKKKESQRRWHTFAKSLKKIKVLTVTKEESITRHENNTYFPLIVLIYVCKLLYIYMLGYDLDFGYMEAVTLLSSTTFQEKTIVCSFT